MTPLSLGAGQVVRTEQTVVAHELQILDQALAMQAAGQRPGAPPPTISGGGAGASSGQPTKPEDGPKDLGEAVRENVDFDVLVPDGGDMLRDAFSFWERFI
jgi:hypothetical protein